MKAEKCAYCGVDIRENPEMLPIGICGWGRVCQLCAVMYETIYEMPWFAQAHIEFMENGGREPEP